MRKIKRACLVVVAPFLFGCLPSAKVTVPAIRGRVVDLVGQPVAGAEVIFTGDNIPHHIATLKTDPAGRFYRDEQICLWYFPQIGDPLVLPITVQARDATRVSPTTRASQLIQNKPFGIGPHYVADVGDMVVR